MKLLIPKIPNSFFFLNYISSSLFEITEYSTVKREGRYEKGEPVFFLPAELILARKMETGNMLAVLKSITL